MTFESSASPFSFETFEDCDSAWSRLSPFRTQEKDLPQKSAFNDLGLDIPDDLWYTGNATKKRREGP